MLFFNVDVPFIVEKGIKIYINISYCFYLPLCEVLFFTINFSDQLEMKAASNTSPLNISNDTDQLDSMPFHRKNKSALDQLQGKIFKTKEKIKKEQTSKEGVEKTESLF